MIDVSHLQVGQRLLPLSFQSVAGEVLHVIGPNGSGKSTLLAAIAGIIASQGLVQLDGVDLLSRSLPAQAQVRAYLSQSDKPAFHLDVFQYLALSLPQGIRYQDPRVSEVLQELVSLLSLQNKLYCSIHHLSGGEWQRVRLAGSCLQIWPTLNPFGRLLILDEPAAPLDIAQERLLYDLIQRIASDGITVIMANHDLNRSLRYADKVLLLDNGVMHSLGEPRQVLTAERIRQVFHTAVQQVEIAGQPYLVFD
ncbi:vitamin B12 ABC transporter ATP-binding protein BtuD [Vibrio injensis]|uniref:vitamin B12 ABC transporter ATP-binding protein BtuD n=1 Tax=Vibrio injensis TaxID=1307414 RepID=UPI000934072A|nr:vitamin B12 ABC transporter ATP-binding protein BtuD [Vibrio injensis]